MLCMSTPRQRRNISDQLSDDTNTVITPVIFLAIVLQLRYGTGTVPYRYELLKVARYGTGILR